MCLGYFLTTLTSKAGTAILLSIVVFILGLIVQVIIFSDSFIAYIWWSRVTPSAIRYILYCLPFFNFGKILFDITSLSEGRFDPITEMVNSNFSPFIDD
jgi:hypothetical protein